MSNSTSYNIVEPPLRREAKLSSSEPQTSPQRLTSSRLSSSKEKRQPSITPRKFNRFFTPRSHGQLITTPSRAALEDITVPMNNRNGTQSSPIRSFNDGISPTEFTRDMKRRKLLHTPSPAPEDFGPEKRCLFNQHHIVSDNYSEEHSHVNSLERSTTTGDNPGLQKQELPVHGAPTRHIKQLDTRGFAGRFLQLTLRSSAAVKHQRLTYATDDWQNHTAKFYSGPDDIHFCTSIESSVRSIPFCAASCNTNSLVAVGDEEGQVRLLESAKDGKPQFKDVFLAFKPHSNAVIDMCFSLDDSLLATASGDQTAKVVDMTTQRTISILAQHTASLKQVRFQPGTANNSIIATSSRDGSVQMWDLRCRGTKSPVHDIQIPIDPTNAITSHSRISEMTYGCIVNSIYDAHHPRLYGRLLQPAIARDGPLAGEQPGRVGDVSVTAIAFLPAGQEHMLLTASEANASVKLWDVRSLHHTRRKKTLPLSYTALPKSHNQWRHFGINSLNLNGNGSRLYALCRDNTVYVYSTAHLILGQAPELSVNALRSRQQADVREGLGPMYGLRHQQLHATSFYVKAAIRPDKMGKAEMLAVGSCDGCTILFPTDDRYIGMCEKVLKPELTTVPRFRRTGNRTATLSLSKDTILISEKGTPLIRGHDREVGALTWTSEGELVTVGDDFLVRCWREGYMAQKLRTGGEEGGQRWGCGWADVHDSYDLDEE